MVENITLKESNYDYLKQNVVSLFALLSKYVRVHLIKERTLSGFIHSIDPLTYSIILLVPHDEDYRTTIIPGHAVLDVAEVTFERDIKPPTKVIKLENMTTSIEDVLDRKQKLLSWFRLNFLTVTEAGENIIFGNLIIFPPYQMTDICTDNPIVAMQVTKLMNDMPQNFEPVTSSAL